MCQHKILCAIVGYEPADLTVHPPSRTAEGGLIFFRIGVYSVPKKLSTNESLCFSELFWLKDQKHGFSLYSLKTNFEKLSNI